MHAIVITHNGTHKQLQTTFQADHPVAVPTLSLLQISCLMTMRSARSSTLVMADSNCRAARTMAVLSAVLRLLADASAAWLPTAVCSWMLSPGCTQITWLTKPIPSDLQACIVQHPVCFQPSPYVYMYTLQLQITKSFLQLSISNHP